MPKIRLMEVHPVQSIAAQKKGERFPFNSFLCYFLIFMGGPIYVNYSSLYLNSIGFSMAHMGTLQSISTVAILLTQPVFGLLSDRAKKKNRIIFLLGVVTALSLVSIYFSKATLWISMCIVLYETFMPPMHTLHDNYELTLMQGKRWDYGQVRMGGTAGHIVGSAISAFIIAAIGYQNIYWISAICYFLAGLRILFMPTISGAVRKREKAPLGQLFRVPPLLVIFIFNLLASGIAGAFTRYYMIYFKNDLGGTDLIIGIMAAVASLLEIPLLWFARRIRDRIGVRNMMLIGASLSALRILLLYLLRDTTAIFIVQMLSGVSYACITFCYTNFMNDYAPEKLKATALTGFSTLNLLITNVILSPIVGRLADVFGPRDIMIASPIIIAAAMVFLMIAFPAAMRKWEARETPNGT